MASFSPSQGSTDYKRKLGAFLKSRIHCECVHERSFSQFKVGTSHFCGGSVLSTTKVASAAHCFQNSFNVVAGTVDNQAGQSVAGASFLQHPAYDSQNILNDFAVATTATPFILNDYLQPIPLVAPSNNRKGPIHLKLVVQAGLRPDLNQSR